VASDAICQLPQSASDAKPGWSSLPRGRNSALVELEIRAGDGRHRVDAFLAFGLVPVPCFARNGSILGNLLDAFHATDKGCDGQGPHETEDILHGKNRRYYRLDGDIRATPTLVPSEETSVGQRFHGQHANARLHARGHHVSDEALVVGVGGVDRHLRGDHLHTPLFEFLQHLEMSFVGLMAGEADVPDLALFPGL